jgi:hypothetical protein
MEKIFVHGKGLIDKSSVNNEKFNLFGQLPGDANKTLLANVKTMGELKAEKAEWTDVFEKDGIVLTVGTNKELSTVDK